MYSRGMSTRDIEATIKEIYGVEVSEGSVSNITVRLEDIKNGNSDRWSQFTSLSGGCIVVKVRQNGKVQVKHILDDWA